MFLVSCGVVGQKANHCSLFFGFSDSLVWCAVSACIDIITSSITIQIIYSNSLIGAEKTFGVLALPRKMETKHKAENICFSSQKAVVLGDRMLSFFLEISNFFFVTSFLFLSLSLVWPWSISLTQIKRRTASDILL